MGKKKTHKNNAISFVLYRTETEAFMAHGTIWKFHETPGPSHQKILHRPSVVSLWRCLLFKAFA